MTYRERREAKAARLREWAEKRAAKADGLRVATPDSMRHDSAFLTQPGRIPERDRMHERDQRAYGHDNKAAEMASRAAGIEAQADHAIYSDDPDAVERLTERIAERETERDRMKAASAAYRKEHRAELKGRTQYERQEMMPYPSWAISNLSATINRQKKRLEGLRAAATDENPQPLRVVQARRDGECERCGKAIETGQYIGKYADGWSHVTGAATWARCDAA